VSLTRGRILRQSEIGDRAVPLGGSASSPLPRGRRVPRELVDAADRARRIVADAEDRARRLTDAAARAAGDMRLRAEAEGRAEGVAAVAAKAVALAQHEAAADERAIDRSVELARLLAERLLGESLKLDPSQVTALARQALREARGARRVRIIAHPDDARFLETERESLGVGLESVEIIADAERARGNLRLETEIGVLDAALGPQLDRLAKKLRESMSR